MTILNVTQHTLSAAALVLVPLFTAVIIFFIIGTTAYVSGSSMMPVVIAAITGSVAMFCLLYFGLRPKEHYTQIEATMDDSTSFNEIMEKYEVIERRGEIYILKVKGDVDN